MATSTDFVDFVLDQLSNIEDVKAKKMFGEYGLYARGKLVGLICDNMLFIKPTDSGRNYIDNVNETPPYPGAKPSFLIEEKIENKEWLCGLIEVSLAELPKPAKRKKQT